MSANEGDTLIPFIDDVEDQKLAGELAQGQYNLTITRNYQNKTRRVEISKILQDVEPMAHRSLSPVAPLANDAERLTDEEDGETVTGAEFELTIKSNNSVIKIQGYDNKSTISFNSRREGNVYDLISKEVDKIFRKPEREEIERAVQSIQSGEMKPRQKKNWKALTKSLISGGKLVTEGRRRRSVDRYPKMVLLQDEKPQVGESNPSKMTVLNDQDRFKTESKKKKRPSSQDSKEVKEPNEHREEKSFQELENGAGDAKETKEESKKAGGSGERKIQSFCEKCTRSAKASSLKDLPNFENEDFFYPSPCCQYPTLYVPIYNRQTCHSYNSGDFCCGGRILKNTTTQTNPSDLDPAVPEEQKDLNDLPIEFLSSFFPRIVVMKSFQEEVPAEDTKIFELPKNESETEDEKGCGELDEKEEEEPPLIEEDLEEGKNEKSFSESSEKEENGTNDDLPLTKIGYSIYDKLNELAMERKKEEEEEEGKVDEVEAKKSPRNMTFEFKNKLMRFTLGADKVDLEVQEDGNGGDREGNFVRDDKMVVRKSKLWYPSSGEKIRKDLALGKDLDKISFSVSESENLVFNFEIGNDPPRKRTSDAKVGTDGLNVAGGDFLLDEGTERKNLSPRTEEVLKSLRNKLEATEGGKRRSRNDDDFKLPGLFLIRPFDLNRRFPRDEYFLSKEREARKRKELPGKLREYYCEDCLATMRLFEGEKVSVKNMIDKFETIIHLGSY